MKKKTIVTLLVLLCTVCLLFRILFLTFIISLFKSGADAERMCNTIDTVVSASDDNVSSLVFEQEADEGVICLEVTNKEMIVVSYLEKDRTSETNYISFGSVVGKADDIISDDPTHIMKIDIADYDDDIYFGICSDERAQELTVNGIPIETEFVHMEIGDTDYSGYFWFWKSADKPIVQLCEESNH